jgi:YHS domain-containing protein
MRSLVVAGLIFTIFTAATMDLSAESKSTQNPSVQLLCPVKGTPVDKKHYVKFDGGKVYFCCESCVSKFAKDAKTYARKARLQLAQSGQAVQKACPLTGDAINNTSKIIVNVAGVNVKLCCADCRKKLQKANAEEKLELVFSKKPFLDGFEVKQ